MNKEKGLETIIVLALVLLIAYLKFEVNWLIYLAASLLAISFISQKLTKFIGKIWFSFSHYLGLLMNQIIMFLIFYFILTPISFLQRLLGNNQILKKENGNSHFHKRNHLYTHDDIEKPW